MQDEDWLVEETGTPDSVWGSVVILSLIHI